MLSTPTTFSPRWSRRFATCIPRKPAAPVTRMVMAEPCCESRFLSRARPACTGCTCGAYRSRSNLQRNIRLEEFMSLAAVALDDKYVQDKGRVYLTGTQALVRLP